MSANDASAEDELLQRALAQMKPGRPTGVEEVWKRLDPPVPHRLVAGAMKRAEARGLVVRMGSWGRRGLWVLTEVPQPADDPDGTWARFLGAQRMPEQATNPSDLEGG